MAFVHGKGAAILVSDVALTGYLNQLSASRNAQAVNVTTFGNDQRQFIAGIEDGTITLSGLFDAAGSDTEFDGALAAAAGSPVTVGVAGFTIGNTVTLCNADEVSYQIRAVNNDAVRLDASFQADGPIRNGVALHDLEAETSTGNFASVDNSTSTAFGAVGSLHVTAFNGTDATIKITDSTDDAIFSDLITFTQATGTTSETASATGTVNRYARVELSGTFTSITFAVGFARLQR